MRATRRHRGFLVLATILAAAGAGTAVGGEPPGPPLLSAGVAGVPFGPHSYRMTLPPTATGTYLPDTGILAGPPPPGPLLPAHAGLDAAPSTDELARAGRAWLAAGSVPGRTPAERDVATRALLDLALLTGDTGASVASPFGPWHLVWPRDASWHAAAFAATGHPEQAHAILRFLARAQDADGTWAARYRPDGSPVLDGRGRQLDAVGWVPWAAWSWWRGTEREAPDRRALHALWPTISTAADAAARALTPGGLPRPAPDYWEQPENRPTIGTAAALLLGLRSAADLAADLGEHRPAQEWARAARRLDAAIGERFAATGFRRHPDHRAGPDSALTLLSPGLAPLRSAPPAAHAAAVARAEIELLMPSGGLRPGDIPRVGGLAWTPATALFALAAAGRGDEDAFRRWFDWLAAHRTAFGALPEKVTNDGRPAAVAPLGWTSAIVLLALAARDGDLPAPPAP